MTFCVSRLYPVFHVEELKKNIIISKDTGECVGLNTVYIKVTLTKSTVIKMYTSVSYLMSKDFVEMKTHVIITEIAAYILVTPN